MSHVDEMFDTPEVQVALAIVAAIALALAIVTPILWALLVSLAKRRDAKREKLALEVQAELLPTE